MQVKKASNKDELKQGTIFSIKNIVFDSKDRKTKLQFQEIYPEVNIDKVDYGIILSQSCDLVRRSKKHLLKTPYITIALLEPIEKFIEQKFSKTIESLVEEYSMQHENYRIINKEKLLNKISDKCSKLFDNRETFYFFISIELKEELTKMFYVNLVKTFPFKVMHYETFAKNISRKLFLCLEDLPENLMKPVLDISQKALSLILGWKSLKQRLFIIGLSGLKSKAP